MDSSLLTAKKRVLHEKECLYIYIHTYMLLLSCHGSPTFLLAAGGLLHRVGLLMDGVVCDFLSHVMNFELEKKLPTSVC